MQTKSYHQQILKPCSNNTKAPEIWENVAKQKIGGGRGGYFWGCDVILYISEQLIFVDMIMIHAIKRGEGKRKKILTVSRTCKIMFKI